MNRKFDIAVVGGGILGLAHAYEARQRGLSVALFERNPRPQGASVRNFGILWQLGQAAGPGRELASRSQEIWRSVLRETGLWHSPNGALIPAYEDDELLAIRQFIEAGEHDCEFLEAPQALARSRFLNPDGLHGALFAPTELGVDPPNAIAGLTDWLSRERGVVMFHSHGVTAINGSELTTTKGKFSADRIILCSGDDTSALFPRILREQGFVRVKLQMMATAPQPGPCGSEPILASGLVLRSYDCFADLPAVRGIRERVDRQLPELDQFGIHVFVAQNASGELLIGDSHECDDAISVEDKPEIDEIILREAAKFCRYPQKTIARRWNGHYLRSPSGLGEPITPAGNVAIVTGLGGAGMTLSFALAERTFSGPFIQGN